MVEGGPIHWKSDQLNKTIVVGKLQVGSFDTNESITDCAKRANYFLLIVLGVTAWGDAEEYNITTWGNTTRKQIKSCHLPSAYTRVSDLPFIMILFWNKFSSTNEKGL